MPKKRTLKKRRPNPLKGGKDNLPFGMPIGELGRELARTALNMSISAELRDFTMEEMCFASAALPLLLRGFKQIVRGLPVDITRDLKTAIDQMKRDAAELTADETKGTIQ